MARLRVAAQTGAVLLVVGLLGLLVWKVAHQTGTDNVAAKVRNGERPKAPDVDLPRLDGNGRLSLASLEGKAVVVNFWASWCDPCREEAPLFEQASREHAGELVVLGIDFQDFTGDARAFVREFGLTYPIVRDANGNQNDKWGVTGAPETFFLDRSGRVVAHVPGAVTRETLAEGIRKALAG